MPTEDLELLIIYLIFTHLSILFFPQNRISLNFVSLHSFHYNSAYTYQGITFANYCTSAQIMDLFQIHDMHKNKKN